MMKQATSIPTTTPPAISKFEQDLSVYFPDLFKITQIMKWDGHYNQLIDGICDMVDQNGYGKIEIWYQSGRINHISLTRQLTAEEGIKQPKIDKPIF